MSGMLKSNRKGFAAERKSRGVLLVPALIFILFSGQVLFTERPVYASDRLQDYLEIIEDIDAPAAEPVRVVEGSEEVSGSTGAEEKAAGTLQKKPVSKQNTASAKKTSSKQKTKSAKKTPSAKQTASAKKTAAKQEAESTGKTAPKQQPVSEKQTAEKLSLSDLHIIAGATKRMERDVVVIPVRKREKKTESEDLTTGRGTDLYPDEELLGEDEEATDSERLSQLSELAELYGEGDVVSADDNYYYDENGTDDPKGEGDRFSDFLKLTQEAAETELRD